MTSPLINILIRSSYRPTTFARCIKSIEDQTYKNLRVIVSYDDERALSYIPDWCEKLPVVKSLEPYGYNLYCNDLKAQVTDGWFFFLDDDDRLDTPHVIEVLVGAITGHSAHNFAAAWICRFIRGSHIKPITNDIIKGKIGMPCIILHHMAKDLATFKATVDGDYYFIKDIAERIEPIFLHLILVRASRRGHGYTEELVS